MEFEDMSSNGKDLQILRTNLKPSFWRTLKTILRQNKKIVLLQFLFGSQSSDTDITDIRTEFQSLKETIESLQNQVNSLQDRIHDLETLSEASKMPLKPLSKNQQYNKGLNGENFISLGKISEEDKIQIIKTGFRLNQEGKISLKKYYESTDPYSLFQSKGYSMKYEAIRKTNLYKQLKP